MPGERVLSESPEKRPAQRTQAEVDKAVKTAELKVGDIVQTDDGARLITQIDRSHQKFKSEPVKFEHDKWQKDPSRNTKILTEKDISLIRARNVNTPEIMNLINESQRKTQELHKQQKEPQKERSVSFSVVSKGDVDGFVVSGNTKENIIWGKTNNGVSYKAALSQNIPVSRTTLESIADGIAKARDYTNEKADEKDAYSKVQDIVNQEPSIEVIHIEGGPLINRDEINFEVSVPNGTEHRDVFNPDGNIEDDIEFDEEKVKVNKSPFVDLDEFLEDKSKKAIEQHQKDLDAEKEDIASDFIEADDHPIYGDLGGASVDLDEFLGPDDGSSFSPSFFAELNRDDDDDELVIGDSPFDY